MSVYNNVDIRWYVGWHQVACHAKSARFQATVAENDITAMCTSDSWMEFNAGLRSGSFDLSLMSDFADDSIDEGFWSYLGTTGVPQSFSIGSAAGSPAYTMKSLTTSYVPSEGAPGETAMATVSGKSSGTIARGQLVASGDIAVSSSGTSSALQVGTVASGAAVYASLHVLAAGGSSPTLDVKVQSDNASGFSSATDRITFSQATTSQSTWSQLSSAAGAITDDWWRVSYTLGGSSPSFAFAVIIGISTAP